MHPVYKLVTYTIKFDAERNLYTLWDDKNHMIGEHESGRELGRDAWNVFGAEAVRYDYDLTKDEWRK